MFRGCSSWPGMTRSSASRASPPARGKGIATRSLELLTRWGFDGLELIRIELIIDVENDGSARVAERAGYSFEGVLRSKHVKDGLRADLGVWSRLRTDDHLT